jgi:aryl-alcohol dehydrogenase-like predicted oxidoreductase
VTSPIASARSVEQLDDLTALTSVQLSADDLVELDEVSR